jgi:dimethylamine monooxygenase subunit A
MDEILPETLWSYLPDADLYERVGVPAWLDELDLSPAPPYVKMGTRSLPVEECLVVDEFRDSELALRNRLLDEQHDLVFAALTDTMDASLETLELVQDFLTAKGITASPVDPSVHPLEAAGRLVQEDLCLMVRRDGDWHLDAAVLCFPSLWSLQEKFARSTSGLHEGVAHYPEELAPRVDRFFDRLRPGQAVWRRNLSIKAYPLLFLPLRKSVNAPPSRAGVQPDGSPFWLRTERQTLQVLPRSRSILFTIKLQLAPARVLLDRRDRARDLLDMYRSFDHAHLGYKASMNPLGTEFLPWLAQVVGGPTP